MVRAARLASGLMLLVLSLGRMAPAHATVGATAHVQMKDFAFSPASVTVTAGDTVQWDYAESSADLNPNCESLFFRPPSPVVCPGHSSTAVDDGKDGKPLWDSGVHRADGFPFRFEFLEPGTYHYICTVHGGANKNNPITSMEGDIIVNAAPAHLLGRKVSLPATGTDAVDLAMLALAALISGAALRRAHDAL